MEVVNESKTNVVFGTRINLRKQMCTTYWTNCLDFHQLLPDIERAIDEAVFIAIDGEFTGLHNGTMVSVFDTAAQYYQKLRGNCMDFLMVQFGLCAVKYDTENKK